MDGTQTDIGDSSKEPIASDAMPVEETSKSSSFTQSNEVIAFFEHMFLDDNLHINFFKCCAFAGHGQCRNGCRYSKISQHSRPQAYPDGRDPRVTKFCKSRGGAYKDSQFAS